MAIALKYIAQQAQDDFLQDYAGNTTFFTLEDWVYRCGAVLGDFYAAEFKAKYAEYRQERKDEVIAFSTDLLNEEDFDVKFEDGESVIEPPRAFTFAYDNQNSGYQNLFVVMPSPKYEAERTSINEGWSLKYMGTVNRIFWYPVGGKIRLIKTGNCNVQKVRLYYVPAISSDMQVPDAMQNYVRMKAVEQMKFAAQQIIDKTNDQNPNKTLETEVNKEQFTMQR
jgi:hypothetical protein